MTNAIAAGGVGVCAEDDVGQVADLHCKVFYGGTPPASDGLRSYYREVFFRNPWVDKDLPSLVYRSAQGKVVGFNGVIPRRMSFDGKPIRVAVSHRLMVDPEAWSSFAGIKLMRAFLSGPQDLSFTDGANDRGRTIHEAAGGSTSFLYSMNWIWPLRPFQLAINTVFRARPTLARLSRPLWSALDPLAAKYWGRAVPDISAVTSDFALDEATILTCLDKCTAARLLRPEYDLHSMRWLLERLKENQHRGRLEGIVIRNGSGQAVGVCLYYLKSDRRAEILLLAAPKNLTGVLFGCLIRRVRNEGAVAIWGRLEPSHFSLLFDNRCFLTRANWALFHTRDANLANAIHRGDAFLSALEGELWLRAPHDIL